MASRRVGHAVSMQCFKRVVRYAVTGVDRYEIIPYREHCCSHHAFDLSCFVLSLTLPI
jgi:hypothetical protein